MSIDTPLRPFHDAAGAVIAEYFGVNLPAQFADPATEYRTASQAAGLIDTNFRAIFSLTGPDRARYLNAVLTSNVRDLRPGTGTIGLLLNAQGHILAELETFALEDRVLVFGHQLAREKTAQVLEKFIIMDDAVLADETAQTGTLAIEGPATPAIVQQIAAFDLDSLKDREHAMITVQTATGQISCRLIHRSLFNSQGAEFVAAHDDLPALWGALAAVVRSHGGSPVGYAAINALRLEAGIPWFGTDFDEKQIPHEAALENTHISYTKGCYTGQEIVERVRSRGHVNRRRAGLQFKAAKPPEPGAPLTVDGAEAGYVTSSSFSPLVVGIGMGYVRREHNKAGTVLECGETMAQVIDLPIMPAAATNAASQAPQTS